MTTPSAPRWSDADIFKMNWLVDGAQGKLAQ
jgi:hypothetical protein